VKRWVEFESEDDFKLLNKVAISDKEFAKNLSKIDPDGLQIMDKLAQ
jgi:hypothetical protein